MARRFGAGVVLATVCVSLTVVTVNISFLNVGLPSVSRELHATNTGLEWVVDGYALVFAGFLLAAGSLGDRIGRKQTLLVGLVIFAVSSGAAAFAHTTAQLIAARCVMGAGAACVMPMTLSILTNIYTTEDGLRRAIGVWAAVASAAAVAAPLVAGLLLAHFWWGSLFVANVPFALVSLAAVYVVVPGTEVRRRVAVDWLGVVLSVLFSAGLVASLIEGPDRGWSSPTVVGGLAGTAVFLAGFILWELRSDQPLVDVRFFRRPTFSVGCVAVALQYFFSFGVSFLVTQFLQLVLGYSALRAGVALMPSAALVMFIAPLGARAFGRWGPRPMIPISLAVMSLGSIELFVVGAHSSYWPVLGAMALSSGGVGLLAAGTTSMVMSAVPAEQSGMASGTQSATRQLGGALGVAIVGSLLAARYTSTLSHSLAGTAGAPFTSVAQRSLAAALSLPRASLPVQSLVSRLARTAFVDGTHVVAIVTGVLGFVAAGVVLLVLARRPAPAPVVTEAGGPTAAPGAERTEVPPPGGPDGAPVGRGADRRPGSRIGGAPVPLVASTSDDAD
ncbi:MAG TPA: MFS transporter [Acidimicrobiales bacterium]|jgi:EmrB/QacA subfamily drug resistance transporter